jgi:hypothetical protein
LTPATAQAFVEIFKPLGFHYVTIDLEGYRQGSLNSVLKNKAGSARTVEKETCAEPVRRKQDLPPKQS